MYARRTAVLCSIIHNSCFMIHRGIANLTTFHTPRSTFHVPQNKGQAALTAVIFFLVAATAIGIGFVSFAFEETATARRQLRAKQSYFLAEAGAEDIAYRLQKTMQVDASETITVNGESVITTLTTIAGGNKEILANGSINSNVRKIKTVFKPGTVGISFYYGIQVGAGGLEMDNNSIVNGNVYANGNITGGNGSTITGDATSAGTIDNPPTVNGTRTEGAALLSLPISEAQIDAWKADAEAGGITVGDVTVTSTQTIGPQKITGKLTVTNGENLIVSGTIWVEGDIVFDNNSIIELSSSYGPNSGVVISDSKIDVKNNASFSGSGDPDSYMMLLAAKDSTGEELINVDNNSLGVIYYAGKGWIKFSNNATAKEATAYGIRLDNNAEITYDTGLANAQFSSGPAGGWDIQMWREVE